MIPKAYLAILGFVLLVSLLTWWIIYLNKHFLGGK